MSAISYRHDQQGDGVAVITMDDGKVNVLSPAMIGEINGALDRAESEGAKAVIIARQRSGVQRWLRLEGVPFRRRPGVDRHAQGRVLVVAPAAVIPEAGGGGLHRPRHRDGIVPRVQRRSRIAAPGYNFQANEVAIGMVLPYPALEILKLRLTRAAFQQAVGLARVFFGESAVAGGWVDEIVLPEVVLTRAEEPPGSSPR